MCNWKGGMVEFDLLEVGLLAWLTTGQARRLSYVSLHLCEGCW